MMIEELWEIARHNAYSWMLPAVLCLGVAVLLLLNLINKTVVRRSLKGLCFVGLVYLGTYASSLAIVEKWRIRWDWGHQHWQNLSDDEQEALTGDGGNLVMGPFLYGGGLSIVVFGGTLLASGLVRRKMLKKEA